MNEALNRHIWGQVASIKTECSLRDLERQLLELLADVRTARGSARSDEGDPEWAAATIEAIPSLGGWHGGMWRYGNQIVVEIAAPHDEEGKVPRNPNGGYCGLVRIALPKDSEYVSVKERFE